MARGRIRTAQEIEELLTGFQQSGLTKRQFCEQQQISTTTFDTYRQRQRKRGLASGQLVKVEVEEAGAVEQKAEGFTLVLAKGRRIEVSWSYSEQHLARLIRIVEAA